MNKLIERLHTFNKDLLPEMVQLKYEAMAENAFRFYRGSCHLFYEDLAAAEALPLRPWPGSAATCTLRISVAIKATISWFISI